MENLFLTNKRCNLLYNPISYIIHDISWFSSMLGVIYYIGSQCVCFNTAYTPSDPLIKFFFKKGEMSQINF